MKQTILFSILVVLLAFSSLGLTGLPAPNPSDPDSDHLATDLELWASTNFSPVYYYDKNEHNILDDTDTIQHGRDVTFLYQVSPVTCDTSKNMVTKAGGDDLLLTVVALYEYDYLDLNGSKFMHYGDTETVALCLKKFSGSKVPTRGKIYSGSTGYAFAYMHIHRHGEKPEFYAADEAGMEWEKTTRVRLFISKGKHAAYKSDHECENASHWGYEFEDCSNTDDSPQIIDPASLRSAANNVGERNQKAFATIKVFNNARTEYVWGDKQAFCGGISNSDTDSPDRKQSKTIGPDVPVCAGGIGGKWFPDGYDKPPYKPNTTIQVKTGNESKSGTNANVYIDLYGKTTSAKNIYLDTDGDDFEKNDTNSFPVHIYQLETVTKICLRHDNTGEDAGWYVSWVKVNNEEPIIFNTWIQKGSLSACKTR